MATKKTVIEIVEADGFKAWYRDGQLHREDGPAVEYPDGHKEWWRNGRRHRDDGPAIEYADGSKEWYRDGRKVSRADVFSALPLPAALAKNFNDTAALQTRLTELEARV